MATLIRSTKSGSDWKCNELLAYNIAVISQDVATFFGNATLPQSSLHQVILENETCPTGGIADRGDRNFFYLEPAMRTPPAEGTVEDLAAHLLSLLGSRRKWGEWIPKQLIAQAIAAFQYNNRLLLRIGKEPIRAKTIPGITILGTTPTFYKITVMQDLVDAIETAQYPENPTIVHKLILPVEDLYGLDHDGMQPLNNRAVILGCFEAFKQFVV
ncbi:hypothetical protein EDB87DRAFT_1675450 [Lactarius vividus]|nr:hypothetical protein EDB87DRAFT_1675450 [Lactarius vividus]